MNFIKNFIREEDGVTAIEYALIASLIAIAIIGAVGGVGGQLKQLFITIKNQIVTTPGSAT
jgi:pilus assembly protein Flp/PilA